MHTCLRPLQNLSNTLFMFPPFSMDMILVWSSSLIQIRKFFSLLCLRRSGRQNQTPVQGWVFYIHIDTSAVTTESFEKKSVFQSHSAEQMLPVSGHSWAMKAQVGRRGTEQHYFIKKEMILTPVGVMEVKEEERHEKRHFEFAEEGEI